MPPAAIGATFVALGASAATGAAVAAVATAVYVGAAYGAAIGAVSALVTGEDIVDGAVKGAVIGGISGGVMKGIGIASAGGIDEWAASNSVAPVEAGGAGLEVTQPSEGMAYGEEAVRAAQKEAAAASTVSAPPIETPAPPPERAGILSKAGGWIEKNPTQAMLLGQTVGGAVSGISEARAREKEIKAAMERDRLQIESQQVTGLDKLDLQIALPTIAGFTERPKWQMPESGLLSKGAKNDAA